MMLNNNSRQYKVVIDGRAYFGDNIRLNLDDQNGYGNNNGYGYGSNDYSNRRAHTIKVYEMRNGFFQRERLIDAKTFYLGKRNMVINVDRFGNVTIMEFRDRGRDRWDNEDTRGDRRDNDNRRDRDDNDSRGNRF